MISLLGNVIIGRTEYDRLKQKIDYLETAVLKLKAEKLSYMGFCSEQNIIYQRMNLLRLRIEQLEGVENEKT